MLSTCNNLSAGLSICLSDYGVEDAGPAKTKKRGNGEGGGGTKTPLQEACMEMGIKNFEYNLFLLFE